MKNQTLSDPTPPPPARRVGRPRDVVVHRAILGAAYAILVEDGLSRFSIDAVAAKAGVARTTVYRRWPDKMKLMHESFLSAFAPTLTYADTGSPEDDFRALILSLARSLSGPNGRIAASVVGLAQSDPQTQQMFLDDFSKPLRKRSTLVLQAAIDKQQFREDLNIPRVLDATVGAIYLRLLLGQPTGPQWANQLVDTVIAGCRAAN